MTAEPLPQIGSCASRRLDSTHIPARQHRAGIGAAGSGCNPITRRNPDAPHNKAPHRSGGAQNHRRVLVMMARVRARHWAATTALGCLVLRQRLS